MTIVLITGQARNGKDTIADYLVEGYEFHKYALADPIKSICREVFNFSYEQLYGDLKDSPDMFWNLTPRHCMQVIGTEMFRNHFSQDIWVKSLCSKIETRSKVVVSDVRFDNEVDYIRRTFPERKIIVIRVTRPSIWRLPTHSSEVPISSSHINVEILNDGDLQSLFDKVDLIFQ